MTRLDLSGNALNELGGTVFDPLSAPMTLNLSDNNLTGIDTRTFQQVGTTLTSLDPSRNGVAPLPADLFSTALSGLISLGLKDNDVQSYGLPDDLFESLTGLTSLALISALGSSTPRLSLAALALVSSRLTASRAPGPYAPG